MARKLTHIHSMKDSVSKSADLDMSASFTSEPTNVETSDNIGLQSSWVGSSSNGEIFVEVSNDYDAISKAGNWIALDFGTPITIASNTGEDIFNIKQIPYAWIRVSYTRASGTGTMNIDLSMKQVGG